MLTLDQFYLLIPSLIAAVIGSTVQFGYKTAETAALTPMQRVSSTLGGLAVTILVAAILITIVNWNPLIVAFISLFLGFVAEKGVRTFLDYMRASKDFPDYMDRGKKASELIKNINSPAPQAPPTDTNQPADVPPAQ